MKRYAISLVLICLFASGFSQTNFNPFGGAGRSGAVSFVIEDTVYIGLGKDGSTHYKDFWKYSKATDQWEQIAEFPGGERAYAQAFTIGEKAYVGIGRQYVWNSVDTTYQDFYSYDPTTNSWTRLNDFTGGQRESAVGFILNDTAYIGTGSDHNGDYHADFWKYNVTQDSWTELSATFTGDAREAATAFTINGKAYVTGGRYFDGYSVQLSDVQEYNPESNTWTETVFADGINLSISDGVAIGYGGKGYIFYGTKQKIVSYQPGTNDIESLGNVLSLEDSRWNGVTFILEDTVYFGLGYYSHDDGSVWGEDRYDDQIYKLDFPKPGAPTDIILSGTAVDEAQLPEAVVGSFTSTDGSENPIHSYALVDEESYPDNTSFTVSGNELIAKPLDFEVKSSYLINIRSTNNYGYSFEKEFTITVNDINEVPLSISISPFSIYENLDENSLVGEFNTTDQNQDVTHSYELIETETYPDNNSFLIDGDSLLAASLDYETQDMYTIKIRSTNSYGQILDAEIDVHVLDDPDDNIDPGEEPEITDSLDEYYSFDDEEIFNELNPQMVATASMAEFIEDGGFNNSCYALSQNESYIELFDFQPESFTINIWFYTSDTAVDQRILHKGKRGGSLAQLWTYSLLYTNNVFRFSIGNDDGIGAINLYSLDKVAEDTWYKISATFDHTTLMTKLYVDGQLHSSGEAENALISTGEKLRIGYYPNVTEDKQPLIGKVDELGLWSRVLSAKEIAGLSYLELPDLTSLNENKSMGIKVFPNPVRDVVYIQCENGAKVHKTEIISITGQLIKTAENASDMNLSHVPNGVYILRITTGSGIVNRQIRINH